MLEGREACVTGRVGRRARDRLWNRYPIYVHGHANAPHLAHSACIAARAGEGRGQLAARHSFAYRSVQSRAFLSCLALSERKRVAMSGTSGSAAQRGSPYARVKGGQ